MSRRGDEGQTATPDQDLQNGDRGNSSQLPTKRSTAEWVTLVGSLAILLSIFGLITFLHFQGEEKAAIIDVESSVDEVRFEGDLYYLPVEVTNRGDITVEDVVVEAELDTGSGTPITADFTITFLAGGERVQGTFVFEEDPRQGELTVHAVSYKDP